MKRILTTGIVVLTSLSLAACGNNTSKQTQSNGATQQVHGKYYFDGTTANLQDVKIKITDVKFYQGDETTNGKNTICFDYTITNKTDKDVNALTGWQAVFNAYQENKNTEGKLEVAPMPSDTSDEILQEQDQSIKKGGSVKCRMAYELDSNKKPVVLKATKGYDDTFLGKKTFKIGKSLNHGKNSNDSSASSNSKKQISKTDKVSVATESTKSPNAHRTASDTSNDYDSSQKEADDYWDNLSPQDKENWHQWSIAESKANDPYQNGYYNNISSSALAPQSSTAQPQPVQPH